MPPRRRTMRPASPIPVDHHDSFPTSLFSHLLAIPPSVGLDCDEHDESGRLGPSAKRRRLLDSSSSSSSSLSICVASAGIEISRSSPDDDRPDFSQYHQDVRRHISLCIENGRLRIRFSSTQRQEELAFDFAVHSHQLGHKADEILSLSDSTKKRNTPGAIWSDAGLRLEKREGMVSLKLSLQAYWNEIKSPFYRLGNSRERQISERIINSLFPSAPPALSDLEPWSPLDFYEAAHVPPKQDDNAHSIEIPQLEATLFPYQKRSVQWMLGREGVTWTASAPHIQPLSDTARGADLDTFRIVKDVNGCDVYLSDVFQSVTMDPTAFHRVGRAFRGGILSEEMGLGKTLEIIGLVLLHKRPPTSPSNWALGHERLKPSGATLIVTPASLRPQWLSELSRHAPGLRVKDYTGRRSEKEEDETALRDSLAEYDVVITTYHVLSAELPFALSPPERGRRHERAYQRKTSPLVQISWWRLCLDEAQMIESGVSQAAALAKLIPKVNAWGVTGTPVKDDVKDLRGLLSFLCYEPFCSSTEVWSALTTRHKRLFKQLFNSISLRHTKALVRDEISLPAQKRYVISMPFTAVEEQHYQTIFKEMADACGVDLSGAPLVHDWDPDEYEEEMRLWLNRLRQTALHPEIGVYGRRVLGNSKERPMRTVEEVLNAMLEQAEIAIRTDERAHLSSQLFLGQLFENGPQVREALKIWEKARVETNVLVLDAKIKYQQAVSERKDRVQDLDETSPEDDSSLSDSDFEVEAESDTRGRARYGETRMRLREALELHHKAIFFCANAYFQIRESREMTEPDSPEFVELKKLEEAGYEDARVVRRQILHESHQKATNLMDRITQKAREQSFIEIPELGIHNIKGGIETSRLVEGLGILYEELNAQANVIDEWRERVIQLLTEPLVDGEEDVETTGEELADSTSVQEEIFARVEALKAIIGDRQWAISGQVNELIKFEIQTSQRWAKNGQGPAPEKFLKLLECKEEVKPARSKLSMRGAIGELRSLKTKLGVTDHATRETLEGTIVKDLLKTTQELLNEQSKAAVGLEAELEDFTRVMNTRLEYYRQLQAVSDAVRPYEGPNSEAVVARARKAIDDLHRRLLSAQAKQRYLLNLKETGSKSNEPRMCVICQMTFTTGVLTVCGHQFCKQCMMLWFRSHHNCPVCKKTLKADNLHDITIKPQELQVRSEQAANRSGSDQGQSPHKTQSSSPRKTTMIYSEFNAEKLEEMKNIELEGPSFTTKVDTLVRHLLWLRQSDPGAKSIIFSQYKDFLAVLQNAFRRFRIGFASIDESMGITKFKEDPAVECFLLHARAHSSGLNLVNASHVFLCEPLLNTALELQAIARVDRIGQLNETTVWLYLVSGTVEESIYNLSVRRRMEHMGRNLKNKSKESTPELLDASIEAANTLEMEHAALSKLMSKDHSAGEVVHHNDLWECLFGHVAGEASTQAQAQAQAQPASSLQERAVMSYLAEEAAEMRRADAG